MKTYNADTVNLFPHVILSVCTKEQVSGDSQMCTIQLEYIQAFNPWEYVIQVYKGILLMPY